jgi:uncharacterized membrane protein YoaK (UPF0700 family)
MSSMQSRDEQQSQASAVSLVQKHVNHKSISPEDITRAPVGRAAILALIAGYVDCHGLLSYKVYASFMSGNTTQAGVQIGQGSFADAGLDLLPILFFVVGAFIGTIIIHSSLRQRLSWLFGMVAALLAVVMVTVHTSPQSGWFRIMTLSLSMGIMTTTVTHVGEQSVSLGYVTSVVRNLGQHLALAIKRVPLADAQGSWDSHGRRAALLAGLWTAFLGGALLAAIATPPFAAWALAPPIVVLSALAVFVRVSGAGAR